MKTHRSSDAHSCGLSKAVQFMLFTCIYYLGQCYRTKISVALIDCKCFVLDPRFVN